MSYAKFLWGAGTADNYTLAQNFSFTSRLFKRDNSDRARAIDSSMRVYDFPLKKSYLLGFRSVSLTQKDKLATIKDLQKDLTLYLDAASTTVDLVGQWVNDFNFTEISPGVWAGTIQMDEV